MSLPPQTLPPLPATMLPLLEDLVNLYLARFPREGPVALERVTLSSQGVALELRTPRVGGMLGGNPRLEMAIVSSNARETVLAPRWGSQDGLSRLTGLGAKMLPRPFLNDLLGRYFGDGLRVEGEQVIIDHLFLLQRLTQNS